MQGNPQLTSDIYIVLGNFFNRVDSLANKLKSQRIDMP